MPPLLRASTLFALSLSPLAMAQANLLTLGLPPHVVKIVAYDQGSFWPAAYARHDNGNVSALGSPWLGGGWRNLASGVNDLARLDATTPGNAEAVAMVGSAGLTLVRWDRVAHGFTTTTLDGSPLAQNAERVRATPFAANHMIAFVTAGGGGVRCYRATGAFLAAPPITGLAPVLDLETLRNASGAGRLLIRNAAGITCIDLAGTVLWTLNGSDGVFARWPLSSTDVRAAWIHHVQSSSTWQLTLLGDNGPTSPPVDLGAALGVNEEVKAAFAVDVGNDNTIDLVVKTSVGVSVIVNPGDSFQSSYGVQAVGAPPLTGPCVPDLLTTDAGRRFRLVDERSAGGIVWNRLTMPNQATGEEEPISLELFDSDGFNYGGHFVPVVNATEIDFNLQLTAEGLAPFVGNGWTQVQVVAWKQAEPTDAGRLADVSETNTMYHLQNAQAQLSSWTIAAQLAQMWSQPSNNGSIGPYCWESDALYWLTVRLCKTGTDSVTASVVSEPVTLVTSMSSGQSPGWSYIGSHCPDPDALPRLQLLTGTTGIGVLGVIQRSNDPPPPPPGGIPTPSDAVQKTVQHPN